MSPIYKQPTLKLKKFHFKSRAPLSNARLGFKHSLRFTLLSDLIFSNRAASRRIPNLLKPSMLQSKGRNFWSVRRIGLKFWQELHSPKPDQKQIYDSFHHFAGSDSRSESSFMDFWTFLYNFRVFRVFYVFFMYFLF